MRTLFSFVMIVLVNVAIAFVSLQVVPRPSDWDNACEHNGAYYNIGESWDGENCTKLTCEYLNETNNMISTMGCGTALYPGLNESCSLVYPTSLGYPVCCTPVILC
ncbi:uncharacterized protein LOC106670639 [Cimex lectularius]|uniref:Single domain-containing protein n=1 Tax=Cimex lectularius TaxID=79782 RepID=A0A8I6S3U2_CIMLE|nr:uncharacterized protein LOC106670639 [Cimex lectularius]